MIGFARKPLVLLDKTQLEFTGDLECIDLKLKNMGVFPVLIKYKLPLSVHFDSKNGPNRGDFILQAK